MKKIFIISILSVLLFAQIASKTIDGPSLKDYDEIFDKISQKRVGMSDIELSLLKSPFVTQHVLNIIKDKNATVVIKKPIIKLYGIFNEKVKINKKWYSLGSKVFNYRLVKIRNSSVVLKRKDKKLELFLRKRDDKIKITETN